MTTHSVDPVFRSSWSQDIFQKKYAHEGCETWGELAAVLVDDVCRERMTASEKKQLRAYITDMKLLPGGRYLYYAGRKAKFFNNCYLMRAEEDTRQDWANLSWKSESALMTGGGIGIDYSVYREKGAPLGRTGGEASGPIPKMQMIDHIGTYVMQGGSRRSAMYASLNWRHGDILDFLKVKDWHNIMIPGTNISTWDAKQIDFNYKAPLDMTNISVNYDNAWLDHYNKTGDVGVVFRANIEQALRTAEPGFSFNFGAKENETLRNACTEVCSEDDSDVCNLASINMSRVSDLTEFTDIVRLATKFLYCGTFVADLPYDKVHQVREKNRRLGLGLMGVHEWLLTRGARYEVTPELHRWLEVYRDESDVAARQAAYEYGGAVPKGVRAIAPTGTIGILAGTTTGIEPLFACAYKRRYLKHGTEWHYQFVVDGAAQDLIKRGIDPDNIEGAVDLAADYERRIKFQADVQDYVDQSISSTINLPEWGSDLNNANMVDKFAGTVAKYAHRLRGLTVYPDAARGGQPLTSVPYHEAKAAAGKEFREEMHDICVIGGKAGVCGS
jgi:ribonucleoside-diphosphate reductase alpha chain